MPFLELLPTSEVSRDINQDFSWGIIGKLDRNILGELPNSGRNGTVLENCGHPEEFSGFLVLGILTEVP